MPPHCDSMDGPVVPVAERAIETGSPEALATLLAGTVDAGRSVADARAYVEAMLGLQVYAHHLYECARASAHEGRHEPSGTAAHRHHAA